MHIQTIISNKPYTPKQTMYKTNIQMNTPKCNRMPLTHDTYKKQTKEQPFIMKLNEPPSISK